MLNTLTTLVWYLPAINGLPVLASASLEARSQSTCHDACRTIQDIVWSCLSIILSCTWFAIHPNIPGIDENKLDIFIRRVRITIVALIAPELLIMWALRQRVVASSLKKKFIARRWTMAHGFFVIMGGFMLFDDESNPIETLTAERIEDLAANDIIDFPKITDDEINDRSKDDIFTKCIILIQTTWFILQFLARTANHLPSTQLEVVTSAYAVLNFVTYAFWWHKPLNVRRPFRVYQKKELAENSSRGYVCRNGRATAYRDTGVMVWHNVASSRFVSVFASMAIRDKAEDMHRGGKKVPTFFAGDGSNERYFSRAAVPSAVIATGFGFLHFSAWSSDFASYREQTLWRISSLTIACVPLLWLVTVFIFKDSHPQYANKTVQINVTFILILLACMYIVARLFLLIDAFLSLRALPPGAYQTVSWITFIPHI